MMNFHTRSRSVMGLSSLKVSATLAFLLTCAIGQAQWVTQNNMLRSGWNAVYLHVDTSHTNISELVTPTSPIEEIWLWNQDLPPGQNLAVPPSEEGTQWTTWSQTTGPASDLKVLPGNSALLVKLDDAVPTYNWPVKGRPVPPSYRWALNGLNFVGFQTVIPGPDFTTFTDADAQNLDWGTSAEVYRYQGGELGATNPVPVVITSRTTNAVERHEAYWIRTGELTNQFFNQYFGSFQITGADAVGIDFGDSGGQIRLFLKNMTDQDLTITLNQRASETDPAGQAVDPLPLLVRGSINPTNLTFGYTNLIVGGDSYALPTLSPKGEPGSETSVVLGLNRSAMTGPEGTVLAGVLEFTDNLGISQVEIGASATVPSRSGLWVGSAVVDGVSQYLKTFATATNETDFHTKLIAKGLTSTVPAIGTNILDFATNSAGTVLYEWNEATGRILVFNTEDPKKVRGGAYLQDGPVVTNSAAVARSFPLRLIVHHDGATARLMQRAHIGFDETGSLIVSTIQEALHEVYLDSARRISAVHLPTSDQPSPYGQPWALDGLMQEGEVLSTTIQVQFDDQASNPFLHTYHPDHDNRDNRDPLFQTPEVRGRESHGIRRFMQLDFTLPDNDFNSLTRSGATLVGNYYETITFLSKTGTTEYKQFQVLGSFSLNRISDTTTLVQAP